MDLFLLARNMRQVMEGFGLGVSVIMIEAIGNGMFRLFFNQSLTSWVTSTVGVGEGLVSS
jgi:hypothetical protein